MNTVSTQPLLRRLKLALLVIATFMTVQAFAIDLKSAKQQGLVGERADGYIGAVESPVSNEVTQLVSSINTKRRAEYERIAKARGLTRAQVESVAGRKAIDKTPKGGWIYRTGWVRK